MASTCCGLNYGDTQTKTLVDKTSKRMIGLRQLSFELTSESGVPPLDKKRRKLDAADLQLQNIEIEENREGNNQLPLVESAPEILTSATEVDQINPKFGMTSVCGRRREMEDMVSIHPSFCRRDLNFTGDLHFFGVFDGHGCSHVSSQQLIS